MEILARGHAFVDQDRNYATSLTKPAHGWWLSPCKSVRILRVKSVWQAHFSFFPLRIIPIAATSAVLRAIIMRIPPIAKQSKGYGRHALL